MSYPKPWKSYADQLDQLIDRGMVVTDRVRALDYLERIGYYRLSGYWFAFRERSEPLCLLDKHGRKPKKVRVERIALDAFRAGITFQNAVDLYVFDKQLRLLGFAPVTHRAIISSIAPIVLPPPNAARLDAAAVARLRQPPFDIYQLDGTAYPGNSGGPLLDADTGQVLGLVNMVLVKNSRESVLSAPSGISYAIPVVHLRALLDRK